MPATKGETQHTSDDDQNGEGDGRGDGGDGGDERQAKSKFDKFSLVRYTYT